MIFQEKSCLLPKPHMRSPFLRLFIETNLPKERLCIVRVLAINPDVLLLDGPFSALDPISTGCIEEFLHTLKKWLTVVNVTHTMQQGI